MWNWKLFVKAPKFGVKMRLAHMKLTPELKLSWTCAWTCVIEDQSIAKTCVNEDQTIAKTCVIEDQTIAKTCVIEDC